MPIRSRGHQPALRARGEHREDARLHARPHRQLRRVATDKHEAWTRLTGPRTRLINAYGLTEATIDSTYFEAEEALVADRFVPIGKPLANSEIYLLDSNLELVPIGIPGELCIGGAGVALGYLNRPDYGGALRRRSLRAGHPPLSHRRSGALASRRQRRVPRPLRPSAQDPRLPHRARRDRGRVLERHPGVRAAAVLSWERRGAGTPHGSSRTWSP